MNPQTGKTPNSQQEVDSEVEPVVLLARTLVFENSVFLVHADHIRNGKDEVPRYLTVDPKGRDVNLVTGVAVLPILDGRFGLLRVYRHALRRWLWEVPRGFVDPGEAAPFAAIRELREETGYRVAIENLVRLGSVAPEPGVIAGRVLLFSAPVTAAAREPIAVSEMGHGALAFFTKQEILTRVSEGEIEDGCTLSLLLHQFVMPGVPTDDASIRKRVDFA